MVSEQGIKIVKILAGVSGILASVIVIIRLLRSRHRKKAAATTAAAASRNNSRKSLQTNPKKKVSKAEIKQWYRGAIDKIVTARLQKESNTKSGEPVFLSHYILQGRLRHWVLHVHNHKYELRQRVADESHPEPYYAAAIAPSGFNLKKYQQSITVHHSPEVGSYFYSMIGWTKLSKEQVDQKCLEVSTGFGEYALLSNNCHDFLQRLADKIITTKAPDWDWFRRHAVGGYHYIEQPALGYDIISAATWSKHLARTKHYLSTAERQKIDNLIVVLEDHIEQNLSQSTRLMAINNVQMTNTDAALIANNNVQYDSGGGGGDGGGGGGGSKTDRRSTIWNEDGGTSSEMAYKNIWFYISSKGYISLKGYGVFVNHPGKISLEIQSERTARVNISVPGEEVDF
ncbi:hypothetical protein PENSOL_c009G02721 [Penicillium solitum]|uniref:Glycoside hydrolase family 31 N-terminal domain-containing protein n=1 Tax=Penicillium solitum TaxID=60172 RepID=A0A1V6RAU7_9EURO|nr:uncharacterized protein PENSOL_c009G02721 [Penicillium solitum]OQD98292.1 hypothetical protein PENSOL_c009G02721 [Penicillium solitum]